jgi:hypothetical protein
MAEQKVSLRRIIITKTEENIGRSKKDVDRKM